MTLVFVMYLIKMTNQRVLKWIILKWKFCFIGLSVLCLLVVFYLKLNEWQNYSRSQGMSKKNC